MGSGIQCFGVFFLFVFFFFRHGFFGFWSMGWLAADAVLHGGGSFGTSVTTTRRFCSSSPLLSGGNAETGAGAVGAGAVGGASAICPAVRPQPDINPILAIMIRRVPMAHLQLL
jgi:hypothetical protein